MHSFKGLQPLVLFLLLLASTSNGYRPLQVSLGRYNNLVIAIDRSVPENATLIEEIKTVINEASQTLLLATRRSGQPGGLAFGNVSILVPDTWPNRPDYIQATWQLFSRSQLRVGPQNPRYGPVPHTEGGGGCGVPGEFTHYPTEFFLDRVASERLFGNRARLVVHEWGHLRWGLMDEAPQENDPHFYIYNSRFYPSRCTEQLDGKMANRHTGLPCKIDRETLTPEPDCIFIPDDNNRAVASFMGHYYVNSIKAFCDQSAHPDEAYQHNRMAPTQQNRMCRSRSVWQIIGNHEDFQKDRPQEVDFYPNIEVVRARRRDVVAVLDISESMHHPNNIPFTKLKAAMISNIRSVLEPETRLGIVTFSSGATNVASLQVLGQPGSATRTTLEQKVQDLDAIGLTDIGDGLMLGLQQLLNESANGGGSLFLVSDGEEQQSSRSRYNYSYAADAIKAAGVVVDVLGLGTEADRRIGDLARDTGGIFYSSYNTRNSFDLLAALINSAMRYDAGPDTPILLHSADVTIQTAAEVRSPAAPADALMPVLIDESARGELLFVFLLPRSVNIRQSDVNLTSPRGSVYDSSSEGFQRDVTINMLSLRLDESSFEAGKWNIQLSASSNAGPSDHTASVVVSTKPSKSSPAAAGPISAVASVSTFKLENNSASPDSHGVVINAVLRSGSANAAVIGAKVSASMRAPDGAQLAVQLYDNGAGVDLRPNDGVYTGVLSPRRLTAAGDYLVAATAESVNGQTAIIVAPPSGASPFVGGPLAVDTRANYSQLPVTNMTRDALAGSFKLETFYEEESRIDRIPPGPIASLDVESVNSTDASIVFRFIAVGDDFDQGTANQYEAYWSTQAEDLTDPESDGSKAQKVLPENVHLGSLSSPAEAGARERLGIRFPNVGSSSVAFVTLRAVDAANNRGQLAFPASAAFQELPFGEVGPTQPPEGGNPSLGVVIGVVVSVVVVAVVIAAVYIGLRKPGLTGRGASKDGISGGRAFSSLENPSKKNWRDKKVINFLLHGGAPAAAITPPNIALSLSLSQKSLRFSCNLIHLFLLCSK
ncbi:hypothetical protein BOX15_Mlig024754g1 [Macrostomum lignano]|uniref:VWFA domain-containing protein n=1 Tax=Macrostomum lignano TaxID=282301 RepID=A0A267EJB5_9PLAT|nr:hypothetical protein BOX15_Mlig024754g1 [Macrostomum lignano]